MIKVESSLEIFSFGGSLSLIWEFKGTSSFILSFVVFVLFWEQDIIRMQITIDK